MSFLTGLALRRHSVAILVMILVLAGGVFAYRSMERELFPEVEFPNITILTVYPSANPDAVARDVSDPIEKAIDGVSGLKEVQSVSSENLSLVVATFEFGTDMEEAARTIESSINGIQFPAGVDNPVVSRINQDVFPVLQLSVTGDRDIPSLQRIVDNLIVPRIEQVGGVSSVDVIGRVDEQVLVTVDTGKLEDLGLSLAQVSSAIRDNNTSFPAGDVDTRGTAYPVHTQHQLGSLEDLRSLTIGFEGGGEPAGGALSQAPPASLQGERPVLLADVAEVSMGTARATGIARTNGRPSLGIAIIKEPDANTVEVTSQVLAVLDGIEAEGLPSDIDIIVLTNDGPEVQGQLSSLLREGLLGFIFAVAVVFVFLLNLRPGLLRGVTLTLRPTIIIGVSIPLSILSGILLLWLTGQTLNFMTLAGLAIAVGRVVDDSIVVLENTYRHIQAGPSATLRTGEERWQATLDATQEVGAAIISSTLTTVVVFIPLAFIQGLVGSFFTPFAIAVSFALIASTVVALTAVPVLGVLLLRRGDFPDADGAAGDGTPLPVPPYQGGMAGGLQRLYVPALVWALRHKAATLALATVITAASLGLTLVVPVTLFPSGTPQFLTIDAELPTGASVGRTFNAALQVEEVLGRLAEQGMVEAYQVTIGSRSDQFGPAAGAGGFHLAGFIVRLAEDVPQDIADRIRAGLPGGEASFTVSEIAAGPPTEGLEINITGSNFTAISSLARQLEADLKEIDGIINIRSNVTQARNEVVIHVTPGEAAEFGLSAGAVGQQVSQFLIGRAVTEVDLEGETMNVVVRGRPEEADDIEKLKALTLEGPRGLVKLGSISEIAVEEGPVSISRFGGERSASITGVITAQNTRAIEEQVQARIDALDVPPGVEVRTGGIFQQIAEGFQDIFTAMAVGIALVYLVMVASLGSLRNPFVIVLSLPLAVVGALVALAITDRTLSLSALMGFLLLIGVVVTNAIVLITFVEQLRERGLDVYDALVQGGRVRLRPILMTAFTTIFALLPLAIFPNDEGGIIGAELATVVIGGLVSSTFLTLIVVPVVYTIVHVSLPGFFHSTGAAIGRTLFPRRATTGEQTPGGD